PLVGSGAKDVGSTETDWREWLLWGDCVEKLPFGDVRFFGRPMGAAFKKSAGGPAKLSIGQRARSSTGLRWCWAAMVHRIAIWRVFVTLDFSTFSTKSPHSRPPHGRVV